MPPPGRSATTSMAKRGQILGYASLTGPRSMKLQEIAELTGIPLSTCAGIISNAKTRAKETGVLDLCADANLAPRPTCSKGMNKALTPAQEQALIELATKDRQHERMSYKALAKEAGLDISPSTVSRILETTVREGCRKTGTFKIRRKKKVAERLRANNTGGTEVVQSLRPGIASTPVGGAYTSAVRNPLSIDKASLPDNRAPLPDNRVPLPVIKAPSQPAVV